MSLFQKIYVYGEDYFINSLREHKEFFKLEFDKIDPFKKSQNDFKLNELFIVNEKLLNSFENGKFLEVFTDPDTGGVVNYNVIFLSDTAAVEYDCGGNELINYCFHVLSATPTMSKNEVDQLLKLVDQYQLNPNGLPFKYTNQTDCKY